MMDADSKGRISALLIEALDSLAGVTSLGTRDVRTEIESAFNALSMNNSGKALQYIQQAHAACSFMLPTTPPNLRRHLALAQLEAAKAHADHIIKQAQAQLGQP